MALFTVFINVLLLVALCVPGYLLKRFKKLGDDAVKVLIVVLVFVAQPMLVGKSFLTYKYSGDIIVNILIAMAIFMAVMLLVLLFAALFFRRKPVPASPVHDSLEPPQQRHAPISEDRVFRFAAMFGNTGYIGLPLISALFPGNDRMILYTSFCIIAFNVLSWTVGVYVITGDRRFISLKKAFLNPVPITILIVLPLFFIPYSIPTHFVKFFDLLGSMTTPLSMIVMGVRLSEIPFLKILTDLRVYLVCALRLILAPLLTALILYLLPINDPDLHNTLIAVSAMPSAAATIIFAEKFTNTPHPALKSVLCSALLSILTIPIICSLFLV